MESSWGGTGNLTHAATEGPPTACRHTSSCRRGQPLHSWAQVLSQELDCSELRISWMAHLGAPGEGWLCAHPRCHLLFLGVEGRLSLMMASPLLPPLTEQGPRGGVLRKGVCGHVKCWARAAVSKKGALFHRGSDGLGLPRLPENKKTV